MIELKENKVVGTISIPIYQIATGPPNYNFLLSSGKVGSSHAELSRKGKL